MKQSFEKKGLKIDNPKDVARKQLELRLKDKRKWVAFRALCNNQAFIDYIYEVLELCGYFNSGEGPVNGQYYEKKGRLTIANKIADDLMYRTEDGFEKVVGIRKAIFHTQANPIDEEME
jgi:hypothetical protein